MVAVGKLMGRKMSALITDMNEPLGRAVGNALEVTECIDILKVHVPPSSCCATQRFRLQGDASHTDIMEVTYALGAEMLLMAGTVTTAQAARALLEERMRSGAALQKFYDMVAAQGGDLARTPLPTARHQTRVGAARDGYVQSIDTERIGWAAIALGSGRKVASGAFQGGGSSGKGTRFDRECACRQS